MALNTGGLKSSLVAAGFSDTAAQAVANAMEAYVKSASVTVNPGIPVATAGTAAAQTGNTTGQGSGSLS